MVVFNIASLLRWRTRQGVHDVELFIGLLIDVAALTAQLYLSGGISNASRSCTCCRLPWGPCCCAVAHLGPSWWWHRPAWCCWRNTASPCPGHHVRDGWASPYVLGLLVCFMLNAILVVVFITASATTCSRRDARLAADAPASGRRRTHRCAWDCWHRALRMNWARRWPLLAVILGDWKRIPALTQDPVLQEEIAEMEAQVKRCKTIVSGILMSAGEARGESSSQTTVRQFLDTLVQNWRATRSVDTFVYDNLLEGDSPMVADATAGANGFQCAGQCPGCIAALGALAGAVRCRCVANRGHRPGPRLFGRRAPPHRHALPVHQRAAGGGLGLFLSMNVARTLGGSVVARNRPEGGAEVTITLSLAAITLQDTDSEDHGH